MEDHGDGAGFGGECDFAVDEAIVEAGGRGLLLGVGEVDAIEASPVDGAETHGAGLATGVEFGAGELEGVEVAAGFADGEDFGVGGGVVGASDGVGGFGDDDAVFDDDRAEGTA